MKVTIDTCGESLDVVFNRLARMESDDFFEHRVFSMLGMATRQIERADEQIKSRIKAMQYLGDVYSLDISMLEEHRKRFSALKAELEYLKVIYEAPEPDEGMDV